MGKKIMNTVLFLVVLGGCVAMTLLTGNGSSGTMIYNFAFLAVMAVIYLAGLFGGMFRVDSIPGNDTSLLPDKTNYCSAARFTWVSAFDTAGTEMMTTVIMPSASR